MADVESIENRVAKTLEGLGVDRGLPQRRNLPMFRDAQELTVAHVSASGRKHLLTPAAASQWRAMRRAATLDAVEILMVSGFRSFQRQLELIQARLQTGESIEAILQILAPPGCSEHHTGRAVDIGTPGCPPLSECFEEKAAFSWLRDNASEFGFYLSYPRDNPFGYLYEPWHWCHTG